jgi:ATP-dependent helicase HrpA
LIHNYKDIRKLENLCGRALAAERHLFRRDIGRLKKSSRKKGDAEKLSVGIAELEKRIKFSIENRKWRKKNRPRPTYNPDLPISERKDEIVEAIRNHPVLIISGETGSGKTTQIPKFCLEAGRGIDGKIGCTQPRRIAALTVSRRIAEELGEETGKSVGYKIRFQDKGGADAYIKIMTDGILLAETQGDPRLNEYDTLIVDEAHERSLNIDFVLGILKNLIRRRRNLKLIITSATIDTEKFSKAFDDAPIIEVSGRMYPVDVRYMVTEGKSDGKSSSKDEEEQSHVDMAVKAVDKLHQESPYGGDILVFMPTEQDIRECCEMIEGRSYTGVTVMPLFARLSAGDQSRVFAKIPGRKIIVSTNVAETSVTIPGIKYVVDSGLARISRYSPRSRTTALPVSPVSRSSADQRKGRCGRVAHGVCIRLYSEEDYENRPRFTPPEILRSNLAEVILRMIALKLGDVREFPFIDRPADKNIQDGFRLLDELGAIVRNPEGSKAPYGLTERGKSMAGLPLDPRLSRILLEAGEQGCLEDVKVIAAALSIQDPRERPAEKQKAADQAHKQFKDPDSDFISLLNIWKRYHDHWKEAKSVSKMRKFCKENFLSFRRMREWRDIHYQISLILEEQGIVNVTSPSPCPSLKGGEAKTAAFPSGEGDMLHPPPAPPSGKGSPKKEAETDKSPFRPRYTAIHQAILSGFLSNIAMKKEKFFYKGTQDKEVMLFPGSGLFDNPGPWIVAAEMVETTRLFARMAAHIAPEWIEPVGKEQCKYTYLRPHWERKRGEVVATEQVSLYGLLIDPGRPVSYGRIKPEEASEIFIRSALVEGDLRQSFPFMEHNQNLIEEIREMEDRMRRRDLLVSDEELYSFYAERLKGICDIRSLRRLLKSRKDDFLRMKKEDLLLSDPDQEELSLFPEKISLGNTVFPCEYRFDPGQETDGVTVKVSSALAPAVLPESVDWVVPGLFREKINTLIKGLPKEFRRQLVPVNQTVDAIVRDMPREEHIPLLTALSRFIYKNFGTDIPASAWDLNSLPDYLKMRISLRGPRGEELRAGRDPSILIQGAAPDINPDHFSISRQKWERTGITQWDFGELPETLTLQGAKKEKWTAYPGLKTEGTDLALRLFRDRGEALKSHKEGMVRLFSLHFARELRILTHRLKLPKEAALAARYFGGPKSLEKEMYESILQDLFSRNIRSPEAFAAHAAEAEPIIAEKGKEKLQSVVRIITAYHECRTGLYDLENANRSNRVIIQFLAMQRDSLANLVPEHFTALYTDDRLNHLERYIRAIRIRAERAMHSFDKDQVKAAEVKNHTDRLQKLLGELSPNVSDEKRKSVEEFFWLLEEYKVSVFAQELKTPVKVSAKKLEKMFGEIMRMV